MAAELSDSTAPPPPLTVTGGDGDADRTGYWTVTGPQDPREVYAVVERSKSPDDGHVFFAWYLSRRTRSKHSSRSYMATIGHAFHPTYEAAMADLAESWERVLRDA